MEFELTKQQQMIKKSIAEFIKKECPLEYILEQDEKKQFPEELWGKLADNGYLGISIPEEYGGTGGGIVDLTLAIEEMAKGCFSVAFGFFLSVCFGGKSIGLYGTEEQKQFYLPRLAEGNCKFALSLTEPDGGTDILGSMKTSAEDSGDQFIVNGSKTFISGADVADYLITVCRTDENAEKKAEGISVLIIDTKAPGVTIKPIDKLASPTVTACEVFYDNVQVPKSAILGERGQGWYQLVSTLNNERIGVAALTLGIAGGVFKRVVAYAKERHAFGKPIGQLQSIQHYLAKCSIEMEAANLLLYKAAWLQENGKRCDVEASKAKYFASNVSFETISKAMSVMGGYSVVKEYNIGQNLHIAKTFTIAPISNEMCLNYIGMAELGLPKSY